MINFRLSLAGTSFTAVKTQQRAYVNLGLRLLAAASEGDVCDH